MRLTKVLKLYYSPYTIASFFKLALSKEWGNYRVTTVVSWIFFSISRQHCAKNTFVRFLNSMIVQNYVSRGFLCRSVKTSMNAYHQRSIVRKMRIVKIQLVAGLAPVRSFLTEQVILTIHAMILMSVRMVRTLAKDFYSVTTSWEDMVANVQVAI